MRRLGVGKTRTSLSPSYDDFSLRKVFSDRTLERKTKITAVLITPEGAEPPGSRRIGVTGALVLILPSETV